MPTGSKERKLPFSPQWPVNWFAPGELIRTGLTVGLGETFGAYADKREVQAALHHTSETPYSVAKESGDDVWVDYVADIGDGFDSTMSIAWLLAQKNLMVDGTPTKRGQVLLLGGDQVYPTATRDNYENRMSGPYGAALPELEGPKPPAAPRLFAIPGNHDWYDGLTSFIRQFCQSRSIGAWQTEQRRSYYAVHLTGDWWVWGIDIQLNADIDAPQLDYFRDVAKRMEYPPDRKSDEGTPRSCSVILVTAEPCWAYGDCRPGDSRGRIRKEPEQFKTLAFFMNAATLDKETRRQRNIQFPFVIAGDLHHYARYERSSTQRVSPPEAPVSVASRVQHYVTAGGGGAYTSATNHLHRSVLLDGRPDQSLYELKDTCYPSTRTSAGLTWRVFVLPFFSRTFAFLVGLVYLLLAWQAQAQSRSVSPGVPRSLVEDFMLAGSVPTFFLDYLAGLTHPSWFVAWAILAAILYFACNVKSRGKRALCAFVHTGLHFLVVWCVMAAGAWLLRQVSTVYYGAADVWSWPPMAFGIIVVIVGGIAGSLVFAAYFKMMSLFKGAPHMNEVFVAQARDDFKSFVRMHVSKDMLEVFVVKCEKPYREWRTTDVVKQRSIDFSDEKSYVRIEPLQPPSRRGIPDRTYRNWWAFRTGVRRFFRRSPQVASANEYPGRDVAQPSASAADTFRVMRVSSS